MLTTFFRSGHRWLCILLLVLGSVATGLATGLSVQTQTPPSALQADPDNAKRVALGQQV